VAQKRLPPLLLLRPPSVTHATLRIASHTPGCFARALVGLAGPVFQQHGVQGSCHRSTCTSCSPTRRPHRDCGRQRQRHGPGWARHHSHHERRHVLECARPGARQGAQRALGVYVSRGLVLTRPSPSVSAQARIQRTLTLSGRSCKCFSAALWGGRLASMVEPPTHRKQRSRLGQVAAPAVAHFQPQSGLDVKQTRRRALRVYGPSQWVHRRPGQQSSSVWEVGPDRLLEQRRHCPHNRVCRAGAQVVGARAAWPGETQMAVQRSPRISLLQAQPCFRKHVICGTDGRRRCVMCC